MAKTRPRTLRIPPKLEEELSKEFKFRGQKWSEGVVQLLTESIKCRRVPGVYFRDTVRGRREAAIGGTGLGVWEVISLRREMASDDEIQLALPQLRPHQIANALNYYRLFPEEIDERIAIDDQWTPEKIRDTFRSFTLGPGITEPDEPATAA